MGSGPLRRHDTRLDAAARPGPAATRPRPGWSGEHDFAAYCKRKEHATTVRAITRLDWRRDADGVSVATVQADAFCQAMVRSLVGAMLAVGDGRRDPSWPAAPADAAGAVEQGHRRAAHGLTLVAVGYPDRGGVRGPRRGHPPTMRVSCAARRSSYTAEDLAAQVRWTSSTVIRPASGSSPATSPPSGRAITQ